MCLGSWFQLNKTAASETESCDTVRTQGFLGLERGENSQERNKLELWLIWAYLYDTTYSCLENPMDGGSCLVGCSPWGREESGTTEQLHFHFSLSCIGEGNGNPLQYSCLENPRDRGAWWAAIYGVTQSQTRLKWLSSSSMIMATHSSVLAWRIPGTEELSGLLSVGLHRVGHDWSDLAAAARIILERSTVHTYIVSQTSHLY